MHLTAHFILPFIRSLYRKSYTYQTYLFIILMMPLELWALDIVKMARAQSSSDKRIEYKNDVIIRALDLTIPEYGPYEYRLLDIAMNRSRGLQTIMKGHPNNIFIAPRNEEWEKKTIAIKIPIRRGLLNYRLLLINKADINKFAQVNTFEDLKNFTAGLKSGWVTTAIFKNQALPVFDTQSFDGLFFLLDVQRVNYIPRAIYEINGELDERKHLLKNVIIEPSLALYLPMPTYVHVSPTEPRIAKRLEAGLRKMVLNGDLDALLNKYYAEDIKLANLNNRKIISIENPYFQDQEVLNDKTLWYQFKDPINKPE